MRRVMPQDYIRTGVNQIVLQFAVLRADDFGHRSGPMYRDQDVIDLRPQLTDVFLHQERIHGHDPRTAVSRVCRLAKVSELRIANEAELDAIPLDDHGLSSVG